MKEEQLRKYLDNAKVLHGIIHSTASWETKYDAGFDLAIDHNMISDNYYDPDTSYEEDIRAFNRAVQDTVPDYEKLVACFAERRTYTADTVKKMLEKMPSIASVEITPNPDDPDVLDAEITFNVEYIELNFKVGS